MENQNSPALNKVKSTLKLKNIKDFNRKTAVSLVKNIQKKKVDEEQIDALLTALPHIAQITTETLHVMKKVSEKAGEEGKLALQALSICLESLKILSQREDLSEESVREITRAIIEAARILQEINKENKKFWLKVIVAITIVIIGGGAVVKGRT